VKRSSRKKYEKARVAYAEDNIAIVIVMPARNICTTSSWSNFSYRCMPALD
jgi:hypothetical protein